MYTFVYLGWEGYARSRSVVLWWAGASLRRDLLHCTSDTLWGRWGLGKVTLPSLTKYSKVITLCLVLTTLWSPFVCLEIFIEVIGPYLSVLSCHWLACLLLCRKKKDTPSGKCGSIFTLSVTYAHCWARTGRCPNSAQGSLCHCMGRNTGKLKH
jgi:hypothetical protein